MEGFVHGQLAADYSNSDRSRRMARRYRMPAAVAGLLG